MFKTTLDLLKCLGCNALSARRDDYCDDPATVYPNEGWGIDVDDSNGRHDFDTSLESRKADSRMALGNYRPITQGYPR